MFLNNRTLVPQNPRWSSTTSLGAKSIKEENSLYLFIYLLIDNWLIHLPCNSTNDQMSSRFNWSKSKNPNRWNHRLWHISLRNQSKFSFSFSLLCIYLCACICVDVNGWLVVGKECFLGVVHRIWILTWLRFRRRLIGVRNPSRLNRRRYKSPVANFFSLFKAYLQWFSTSDFSVVLMRNYALTSL